jgi:hypothetical protein
MDLHDIDPRILAIREIRPFAGIITADGHALLASCLDDLLRQLLDLRIDDAEVENAALPVFEVVLRSDALRKREQFGPDFVGGRQHDGSGRAAASNAEMLHFLHECAYGLLVAIGRSFRRNGPALRLRGAWAKIYFPQLSANKNDAVQMACATRTLPESGAIRSRVEFRSVDYVDARQNDAL